MLMQSAFRSTAVDIVRHSSSRRWTTAPWRRWPAAERWRRPATAPWPPASGRRLGFLRLPLELPLVDRRHRRRLRRRPCHPTVSACDVGGRRETPAPSMLTECWNVTREWVFFLLVIEVNACLALLTLFARCSLITYSGASRVSFGEGSQVGISFRSHFKEERVGTPFPLLVF